MANLDISPVKVYLPLVPTMEDVFGSPSKKGMVVRDSKYGGYNQDYARSKRKCPIFKRHIGYKCCVIRFDAEMWNSDTIVGHVASCFATYPDIKECLDDGFTYMFCEYNPECF